MPSMIVAPEPLAVEEGAKVLQAGGNAVDAAVTCAFIQGVVNPQSCGIGGYLLVNLATPAAPQQPCYMDAPALAGALVTPAMWHDQYIGPNPAGWGYFLRGKLNTVGYQSICTPGTVKGLAALLERFGTISWERAIAPAARIAEQGFIVDSSLAATWKAPSKNPEDSTVLETLQANAEARRIYLKPNGAPRDEGELLANPDYGRTLRRLASAGADDFYHGELAQAISADLAANGGFVTAADLAGYQLREEPPQVGSYRGYTVISSQAPHGGPTLLSILNILEGYDLARLEHNAPDYIYLVAMAMKAAFADRNTYLGDPACVPVPLQQLTSKQRAEEWRHTIDRGEAVRVAPLPTEPPDTTHISVVDRDGMAVALTHSLGSSSGVITPGLGFIYNNSMINFHPLAGHPNSIAPGKGRTSGMAPTLVYRDGQLVLVIGAPGASRIITAMAQVLINVLDFGMSISDAVLAPRFDCQGELITCQARIPEYVCSAVRRKHPIERLPRSHGGLALVHAIARDPRSGRLSGGADTGSGGMALLVP